MKTYKKFIIIKDSEYSQSLMLVRKQPDENYPDGGLGLLIYNFGKNFEWPKNMESKYTKDEQDIVLKILQYETRKAYIMRTLPIHGTNIVDEDDDLYELVKRYIYGDNYV